MADGDDLRVLYETFSRLGYRASLAVDVLTVRGRSPVVLSVRVGPSGPTYASKVGWFDGERVGLVLREVIWPLLFLGTWFFVLLPVLYPALPPGNALHVAGATYGPPQMVLMLYLYLEAQRPYREVETMKLHAEIALAAARKT